MRVHLGGHLSWYDAGQRAWLDLAELDRPATPLALLRLLGVPPAEVVIVRINGRPAELDDTPLAPGDLVEYYPPVGGG